MKYIRETYEYVINHIVNNMVWKVPNDYCAELLKDDRISRINAFLSEYASYTGV